jgi:hypothetical protein
MAAATGESVWGFVSADVKLCVSSSMTAGTRAATIVVTWASSTSLVARPACRCARVGDDLVDDEGLVEMVNDDVTDPELEALGLGGSIVHTLEGGEGYTTPCPSNGSESSELVEDDELLGRVEYPESFVNTRLEAELEVFEEDVGTDDVVTSEGARELDLDAVRDGVYGV